MQAGGMRTMKAMSSVPKKMGLLVLKESLIYPLYIITIKHVADQPRQGPALAQYYVKPSVATLTCANPNHVGVQCSTNRILKNEMEIKLGVYQDQDPK